MQKLIFTLAILFGAMSPTAVFAQSTPQKQMTVYFAYDIAVLTAEAQDVAKAAADSYRSVGATRIDVVGHTDTGEADSALWLENIREATPFCKKMSAKVRRAEPSCVWKKADAMKLGLLRAKAVSAALIKYGVPKKAIHATSAGDGDLAMPTPPATKEPLNRGTTISIY